MDIKSVTRLPVLLVILTQCAVRADHPWSPIVKGRPLVPPVIPTYRLQHVIPDVAHFHYAPPYRRREWRPSRRRRRRRFYRPKLALSPRGYNYNPGYASESREAPQYRQVRSRPLIPQSRGTGRGSPRGSSKGSPRSMQEEERGFVKDVRNLFGAPEHCLEEGVQYSCTFTPVCWLTGGIATSGCESFMYSCCKPPELGRSEVDPIEKRGQDWLHHEPECGISRHRQFAKRIIGGEKAKFAELPWQVHIRISSYQCGGVLLNHWYIATAAHCVHRAKLNKITVHLGEYDTKDGEEEPLESQTYKVDHIVIHPEFRYMLTQPDRYDVALLHLERPVFYQENIIPICLPPSDISLEGKVGMVAGWGKTDNSFGKTGTNILNKVLVPIIENEKCIQWHEDKNILVQLHSEMFCAGHKKGKMDACLGDSGGPLIIHYNGRWTLIGITSAGFGCAVDKQPGIYHKIGKTTKWILSQITP